MKWAMPGIQEARTNDSRQSLALWYSVSQWAMFQDPYSAEVRKDGAGLSRAAIFAPVYFSARAGW
jgi:hypothetical protein